MPTQQHAECAQHAVVQTQQHVESVLNMLLETVGQHVRTAHHMGHYIFFV
jgi:hypothetical protein